MRRSRKSSLCAAVVAAVVASLLTASPSGAAVPSLLTLVNRGFENGPAGWQFSAGTGTATNYPHTGSGLAYLNGGEGMQISQSVTAPAAGSYAVSAWIAALLPEGRFVVRVNGAEAASIPIAAQTAYTRYRTPAIAVVANDVIEVAIESGQSWVNVDDVAIVPAVAPPPLPFVNPGFEGGATGWRFGAGTGTATNNPHGGTQLAYLDAGADKSISQLTTATAPGRHVLSAWIATGGPGGTLAVKVNGKVKGTASLPGRDYYARYSVGPIAAARGDQVEVVVSSGTSWVNVDDLMVSPAAPASPTISSSDPAVVEMFDWAKRKANSWVIQPGTVGPVDVDEGRLSGTGTNTYQPSYWAGYAHRTAYYSRDMVHQFAGAQVLGLNDENLSMTHAFAASSTPEHKYYPVWAINFDNDTYLRIDYNHPNSFVREVPATFELVEKANQAYRWSGDARYVQDPALWEFYRKATDEFIALHDGAKPNGVAEGTGKGIFAGAASYNEHSDEPLAEAGDSIASQYQAFRAMASLASGRGDTALAAKYEQAATDLKAYFNSTWTGTGSGEAMVRGYTVDGEALTGWGKENSWFMPMKQILDPGPRRQAYLDYIDQQARGSGKPGNIEAITYLPDTFFNNNRPDTAWYWMNYVYNARDTRHSAARQGPNGDYPEVSFTLLSQVVEGLLGVAPNAPRHQLATQSRLPSGMDWIQVADIPVGKGKFKVRHDGARKSTVTNQGGDGDYVWEARFPGSYSKVKVNGAKRPAQTRTENGVTYSYAAVTLGPGRTAVVEAVR
ncbi:hypothetical protein ACIA8G_04430 [Lentzea sp. NPDC051213]|uniref:hypothetical protein n=1 Tax=Lentzea sp. NPDC051213 TaxID=3364126 RepID=UPI0037B5B752